MVTERGCGRIAQRRLLAECDGSIANPLYRCRMASTHAGLIKASAGFDPGEVEVAVPADIVEAFEGELDNAGIEHERPLVHSARSDDVIVLLKLAVELATKAAEIINAYSQRDRGKEVHWDEHSVDVKGYSAEDVLKFMKAAPSEGS